jgi:Rrf2 family iron-sulfur cluster assembly transcriptional regulator
MRISATEEYGLRCLLALAQKGPGGQMSIPEIAQKEGLSVPYASKLLWMLRKAGLVNAERGRSGGFSIARPANDMTLHEVIAALGGPLVDPGHCKKFGGNLEECIHSGDCSLHDMLGGLSGMIREFLSGTTIEDLLSTPGSDIRRRAFMVLDENGDSKSESMTKPGGLEN